MLKVRETSDVAIIGLGSFGTNVLNNFVNENYNVTIIDNDKNIINKLSHSTINAVVADSTQISTLEKLGIQNYDHVVVAIGQDLNASILTTLNLLELGISNIIVKASDENHAKILKKIGVNHIIYPDREMGKRVAMQIMYRSLTEIVELNELQVMAQLKVSNSDFVGKDLMSLDITNKYGLMIAAIRRNDELIMPSAQEMLQENDLLVIIGESKNVEVLSRCI